MTPEEYAQVTSPSCRLRTLTTGYERFETAHRLHEPLHKRAKRDPKAKVLCLQSFLRKGVSLSYVGRNYNLKDLNGGGSMTPEEYAQTPSKGMAVKVNLRSEIGRFGLTLTFRASRARIRNSAPLGSCSRPIPRAL